jgi:hypothetical protein
MSNCHWYCTRQLRRRDFVTHKQGRRSHANNNVSLFALLTKLYRREEARTRVAIKLHTFNINIAIMHWTPELEQDVPPRTTLC